MSAALARLYAFKFFDAFILIYPLYAVMFVDAGLPPAEVSICLAVWSLVTFALQAPSGVVADLWPRSDILALAQLARAAGFALWLVYPHFWGFLAGLALWGVKSAFTAGTFEALLYDGLKAEGRAGAFVRILGRARAVQAAAVICAALGAAGAARFGYKVSILSSEAAIGVCALLAASLPRVRPAATARSGAILAGALSAALTTPGVLGILGFSAVVLAFGGALEEFWPVFGAKVGLGRPAIALFVSGQSLVEAFVSLQAHRIARAPPRRFHLLLAVSGAGLAGAAALFRPGAMLLLAAYSGALRLLDVVYEGRLQHAAASEMRATMGSLKSLAAQVALLALYGGFGAAAQAWSYRAAFLAAGLVALAVGAACALFARPLARS